MNERIVELHEKQSQATELYKTEPISAYCGGIGSGKTVTGTHFVLDMIAERPNELGAIFSPTATQLNQMTLVEFKSILEYYGYFQDEHYVVGINPWKKFRYRSKFPKEHHGVYSFASGSQIYTFSLKSFYRGASFGWIWGDEIQEATSEDLTTVIGRMRGSPNPKTFYSLTPPRGNPYIDELIFGESHIPVTFGTTYDNEDNLPKGYIQGLEKMFDKITFAREVLCQRVKLAGLNWLYTFKTERNVSSRAKYQPKAMVYVSFDFNKNPIVAVLSHRGHYTKEMLDADLMLTDDERKSKIGKRYVHYFDTVIITPEMIEEGKEHIQKIIEQIKIRTPYQALQGAYLITGDATGRMGNVLSRVGATAWSQVLDAFNVSIDQILTPRINPTHVDSRVLCNGFFANFDEVFIAPHLKELIYDCEWVKSTDDGDKKKDNRTDIMQRADLLDALTYDICTFNGDWINTDR